MPWAAIIGQMEKDNLSPAAQAQTRSLQPLAVRVKDACRIIGIGRSKLYELISAGEIKIIKVGAITLIPVANLERFLDRQVTS